LVFPDYELSKAVIELIGLVEESFPNATFRVRILSEQAKDHELLCHLAGRMRKYRVRILPGDRVRIEMTPYDLSKGRIVYRFRSDQTIEELEKEKAAKKAEAEEAKENNETTTNPDTDPDPITTPQSST
jgi:translation initiation factor IF-1